MADIDNDLASDTIDIERAIIDPDYRRIVMALLRQTQPPVKAVPGGPASAASKASRLPD